MMIRNFCCVLAASLALAASLPAPATAASEHDALIAKHAAANGVPESLVRRVIHIESKGNPRVVSKGNYGLMQIRLGTAKAMGYTGGPEGLLDADTNMTYAVKYLAGAYRAAGGSHEGAIRNYQKGYYYEAKRQGFSPYAVASAPAQAAAPDPTIQPAPGVAAAVEREQAAERRRAERELAAKMRLEQQKAAEASRVAAREAAEQARVQERTMREQAVESQRAAHRQAMLQQRVEREQVRQEQAVRREQPAQQRTDAPRAAAPAQQRGASNYSWYNPMRFFNHPAHKAHPYKPIQQ